MMRYLAKLLWLMVSLLLLTQTPACTATHAVRTIGKGNTGVETTLGGPVFTNLGAPVPAPNLFVGGRYGVSDDLDVSAHYNLTGPFVPGVGLNLVLSGHWFPIQPGLGFQRLTVKKGWSLGGSFSLHSITDFQSGYIALPVFDIAFGWRYKWLNPYVGASLGLNFYRPFASPNVAMLNPYAGADFILGDRASLSLRLTIYDAVYNMYGAQIDWVFLVDDASEKKRYGALGVSLGFAFDFVQCEKTKALSSNLQTGGDK
jgi:hypothetical protein